MVKESFMTKEFFAKFNAEMARLREITWQGYTKTLKEIGISYLGGVNHSAKLHHNNEINMHTYGIYLAASSASGFDVCPKSETCKDSCLYGSGKNKVNRLSGKTLIDDARILKTRLFFANKEIFMLLLIHEIEVAKKLAESKDASFQFVSIAQVILILLLLHIKASVLQIYFQMCNFMTTPKYLTIW